MTRMKLALLVLAILIGIAPASAQPAPPFVLGEWASNCDGGPRIGYAFAPDRSLAAYTVTGQGRSYFAAPKLLAEDAEFFTIDYADGAPPIVWKKARQTIQPWRQGEGDGAIIKDGTRDGAPTPILNRCR